MGPLAKAGHLERWKWTARGGVCGGESLGMTVHTAQNYVGGGGGGEDTEEMWRLSKALEGEKATLRRPLRYFCWAQVNSKMAGHACNLSTRKSEVGEESVHGQSGLCEGISEQRKMIFKWKPP